MRTTLRPAEGWLSLLLVLLMALAVGWSLDDPGWVLGRKDWTDFLPYAAAAGVLGAFVAAKIRWPTWVAHFIVGTCAALLLPIVVGTIDHEGIPAPMAFQATADAVVGAWADLAVRLQSVTGETLHHLLAFGILAFGTGQAMSYAVFAHRRPLDAAVVGGLILVVNMSATRLDQLRFIVLFTGAALFLLVGMHALDERMTWVRRRIGDPSAISSLYLRGGTVFIVLTVMGSLVLTVNASSAPLSGAWSGASGFLIQLSEQLQAILPGGGDQRPGPVSFSTRSRITGQWSQSPDVAFTAKPPANLGKVSWRVGAWDRFVYPNGVEQSQVDRISIPVTAGDSLADFVADRPDAKLSRTVVIPVTPVGYPDPLVLSPGMPLTLDRNATVDVLGEGSQFMSVRPDGSGPYTVTALLWETGNDKLNAAALRIAGTDYPADISRYYLGDWQQFMPADGAAIALRDKIRATAKSDAPYDIATAFETTFRDQDQFRYDPDVRDLQCAKDGIVECFAQNKRGYCMHYATTMALMLRSLGIPTRIAQGFLTGDIDKATGVETVRNTNAHAWVEVYFPGWGWMPFDPTGGAVNSVPQSGALPAGPSISPGTSASPSGSGTNNGTPRPTRREFDETGGSAGPFGRPSATDPGVYIALTALLVIIVGSLAAIAWWRGPRGDVTPDVAWRTVSRLAARFGFARRPTQTVYEYAGSLSEVIPVARDDLHTVATAKVEVAYARSTMTSDRLRVLRDASRRLRVKLLRLALRRRKRAGVRSLVRR